MKPPFKPSVPRQARPGMPGRPRPAIRRYTARRGNGSLVAQVTVLLALLGGGGWWVSKELSKDAPAAPVVARTTPEAAPAEESAAPAVPVAPAPVKPPLASVPTAPPVASASPTTPEAATPAAPVVLTAMEQMNERLSKETDLVLLGIDATKAAAVARDKELLEAVVSTGAWDGYRELLMRSLSAVLNDFKESKARDPFEALWKEPVFYQAFMRWQVLERFSASDIAARDYAKSLFSWLMVHNEAMEEVVLTVKPGDDKAKVAALMADVWNANRPQAEKYFNLALACAVVFDREVKIEAAADADRYSGSSAIEPIERYLWYVEKNEKGKLTGPIERMSARDLVWVVCAPVSTKELEWAISKVHLSRKNWGNAYGMIEYLMERAVKGINPYEEYTFAEILKKGGICGDQSYFCVNTARAHGIPAMTISGETDLGGHAWAAVKVSDDEWNTQVGRIGGAANGEAGNPQTGGRLSEQEVWLWNDRAQQSRPSTLNVFRHLWLADLLEAGDRTGMAESSVRVANVFGKAFSETWTRLYDLLAKRTKLASDPGSTEIVDAWVEFVAEMRAEFRENPRMATLASKAESEYIFPYAKEGDIRRSLARDRRRMERNASEQKDLITDSVKREADVIHSKGSADATKEIASLYSRALREYGGSITGFKRMAEDYFDFAKDDKETALQAARDIELAFNRVVKTGSNDWFRANTETSIYKMICSYYRTAGDEGHAVVLEKRYMRLLKDAERGAL